MRSKETDLWKPRNPITHRQIRHEVLRQITIPILVVTVILLVIAVLAARLPSIAASLWADIALIWLITPALFLAILGTLITAASAYLVIRLIGVLPPFFFKAQNFLRRLDMKVDQVSKKATEPVIKLKAFRSSTQTFKTSVRSAAQRVVETDRSGRDE